MCLLVPFLPSCLLKIYLELKQAARGGRSDYLLGELVTGPRAALFSTSVLHFQQEISQDLRFSLGRASSGSSAANEWSGVSSVNTVHK